MFSTVQIWVLRVKFFSFLVDIYCFWLIFIVLVDVYCFWLIFIVFGWYLLFLVDIYCFATWIRICGSGYFSGSGSRKPKSCESKNLDPKRAALNWERQLHNYCKLQVAQVYQTLTISRLLELASFTTHQHMERLIVECARNNDMQVRVNL